MANFFLKREIKAVKIAAKSNILNLVTENPQLGYVGYLSANKFEPDQRFEPSYVQIKEKFIAEGFLKFSSMKSVASFFFQHEDDFTDLELFSVMSFFSFFNLFRSDFFSLFALPNFWDECFHRAFSGHIQQIGFPKEIFSSKKYHLFSNLFTIFFGVLRVMVVQGSFWVARPLSTIQKLLTETLEEIFATILLNLRSFFTQLDSLLIFSTRK